MIVQPISSLLMHSDKAIEWCVKGFFPAESTGILAGAPGIGKSWMLLDLAVEVARGGLWLGHFSTSKGTVLFIDEESNSGLLRLRLRKLLKGKQLRADELDIYAAVGQGLCFSRTSSVDSLRQELDNCKPSLIIVDSLIRVLGAEENSATDMSKAFAVVKDIVRQYSCTVVFADHLRKPGKMHASPDLMLRGSSEKVAFVDSLLSLRRKGDQLIVEHSKSRFALPQNSFGAKIEDPNPDSTKVSFIGDVSDIQRDSRMEEAQEIITDKVPADEWIGRKDLVALGRNQGIGEKAVDQVLMQLQSNGIIIREDRKPDGSRGGKAAYYQQSSEGDKDE